jgi:hypothetical protein
VNSLDLQSILEEETVDGGEAILAKTRRRAALKLPCRWHTQKKAPKPNPTSCCCCCFLLILTGLGKSSYKLVPGNNKSLIVPKFSIDDDNDHLGNAFKSSKSF